MELSCIITKKQKLKNNPCMHDGGFSTPKGTMIRNRFFYYATDISYQATIETLSSISIHPSF